jgi:hypothetical protein
MQEEDCALQDFLKIHEATPRSMPNPARTANPSDTGPAIPSTNARSWQLRFHTIRHIVLWIIPCLRIHMPMSPVHFVRYEQSSPGAGHDVIAKVKELRQLSGFAPKAEEEARRLRELLKQFGIARGGSRGQAVRCEHPRVT